MKAKIIGAGLALWLATLLTAGLAQGQSVPQLINYQGRLTNAVGQPLDGVTVTLTFTFASAAVGGTTYLTVTQNNVAVSKGIYSVLIGSGTVTPGTETLAGVFQNHTDVWMGVAVNADGEMTPRQRVAATAYAFRAGARPRVWTRSLSGTRSRPTPAAVLLPRGPGLPGRLIKSTRRACPGSRFPPINLPCSRGPI